MTSTSKTHSRAQAGLKILFVNIALLALSIIFLALTNFPPLGLLLLLASILMVRGYVVANAQKGYILLLFGQYQGAITQEGFYWVHPLMQKKTYRQGSRTTHLAQVGLSDAQGMPITAEALLSWEVNDPEKALAQLPELDNEVRHQSLAALSYLLSSLPYFPQTHAKTGQKIGIKGQKAMLERKLWENLQKRVDSLGIQIRQVSIQQLSPPASIAEQQQLLLLETKARQNWAQQAVPLAQRIIQQVNALPNSSALTPEEEKTLLKELILRLCNPKEV